jgi:hypothetical protein
MHSRFRVTSLAVLLGLTLTATASTAQTNPRFGVWKMKSDAPPPAINIMTYEPYGDGGMRITVESTNREGRESKWGYVTMFDGVFRPVTGRDNAETSVEIVDAQTTRIANKQNGRVSQIIINVLSEDHNTINNEYIRMDEEGNIIRVSHAVYERIQ